MEDGDSRTCDSMEEPAWTHLQLADGLEAVHLILPQLHVFTKNLLAFSDERNMFIILYFSS